MKNILIVAIMFAVASSAMAADKSQISATAEAMPISATATAKDDISAPYVDASRVSAQVSSPLSGPRTAEADEGEGSVALAGLGFGLVGLIGVAKVARRKKQKAKSEGSGIA